MENNPWTQAICSKCGKYELVESDQGWLCFDCLLDKFAEESDNTPDHHEGE